MPYTKSQLRFVGLLIFAGALWAAITDHPFASMILGMFFGYLLKEWAQMPDD